MTTINVNTVAPAGSVLTVGDSGDTIVAVDEIKVNTVKDAGGNTLWVSNGSGVLSSVSGFGGALNLLSTQTASGSATISFTSGIDSTYKEYIFKFININAATDTANFTFQASTDGGSSWGVTQTTTFIMAYHEESDGASGLQYQGGLDLAQSTDFQIIYYYMGSGSDECGSGELHLFNPASTTYVKNWYARGNANISGARSDDDQPAGYFNTASAIDGIQFKMSSGNFDGKIKLYGVS